MAAIDRLVIGDYIASQTAPVPAPSPALQGAGILAVHSVNSHCFFISFLDVLLKGNLRDSRE
jgi:hypothetical protein